MEEKEKLYVKKLFQENKTLITFFGLNREERAISIPKSNKFK